MSVDAIRVLVFVLPHDAPLFVAACHDVGVNPDIFGNIDDVCRGLAEGADVILTDEAALDDDSVQRLNETLKRQPSWSAIPVVMLLPQVSSRDGTYALERLGEATLLLPVDSPPALASTLRMCLHARRRQYRLRDEMELLHHREERFHLVADASSDTWWDLDLVAGTLWLGQSAHELFDRTEVHDGKSTDLWHVPIHHEDRERVLASFAAALAANDMLWTAKYRLRKPDGDYADVFNRANIMRDAQGCARRIVGAIKDITEQKRSEELSARLATIVEFSEDAIVSKNLDGIITSWNAGAERLFGYGTAEAVGQHITLIIPPQLHEEERAILARLRQGRRIEHFETERRTKDGRRIDVSLSVSPLRDADGKVIGASKVARDITLRRQTEQMLAKQAERLRLLLEAASALLRFNSPDAMLKSLFLSIAPHLQLDAYFNLMVDETGRGLDLSSWVGVRSEAVAQIAHISFGQGISGSVAERRQAIIATSVQQSEEPMQSVAKRMGIRACVCNPLILGDRLIGTLMFASRQKDKFETDELEFLDIVCRYVTMAYDRVGLIDKLKENDRRKDEFIATLAHELRNPLAPIHHALQILRVADADQQARHQALGTMERQVTQIVRLVDDLLDAGRIASGKLELRKESVDLGGVVKNAVDMVRPVVEAARLQVNVDLPESNVVLLADPVRLAQVLTNLLNNAAKFTPPGGRIWLKAARKDGNVVLSVRDSGIGIPGEALSSIFDMFTQAHLSKGGTHGGLGIGLTLVKRLVELHHGTIEAKSEGPGRGAEFVIRLPITGILPPPSSVDENDAESDASELKIDCRILIADDNEDAAESLAVLLQMMGVEVRTVYDGLAAIEQMRVFRPAMALLDIGMPGLSGHDVAQRVRAEPWGRDVVLVALTGWGQVEDKRRSIEAGFDYHFTKPVDPDAIERLIETTQYQPLME